MRRNYTLCAALAAIALAASAQAATITWQSPVNISGDSDIKNVGIGAIGYNVGGDATTVNGVNFLAMPIDGGSSTATSSDGNVVLTSGQATLQTFNGFTGGATVSLSPNYDALLGSEIYNESGGQAVPFNIDISGLTTGQAYQVQFWVNDSRTCCGFRSDTLTAGNSASINYNDNGMGNAGIGQYVIGTFIADAASQTVALQGQPIATGSTQLGALSIQQVPEPASIALLGCGAIGLLLTARRRTH